MNDIMQNLEHELNGRALIQVNGPGLIYIETGNARDGARWRAANVAKLATSSNVCFWG
jgi:hypothetical protein